MLDAAGVEVTGWLRTEDAWQAVSLATVYAHTATYEGFPLTVLDAAKLGVPLVLRSIPAFDEYSTSRVQNPEDMADAILACVNEGPGREAGREVAARINAANTHQAQRRSLLMAYRVNERSSC